MLRIECKSDYSPLLSIRSFGDRDQRLDTDKNIKDCYAVRWVGANLFESVQITHGALGVIKSRDFYQYFWISTNEDNSVVRLVGRDHP